MQGRDGKRDYRELEGFTGPKVLRVFYLGRQVTVWQLAFSNTFFNQSVTKFAVT